jgi:hypothetical protein
MTENPIKHKKCAACKKVTYYNPTMPYQKIEERNPLKCAYCGAVF